MDKDSKEANSKKDGFFNYVFNFDEDTKSSLLNILQFSFLAIIPIVVVNKGIQKFVPEADDEKSSLEIVAEVLIQVAVMFVCIFYITRIIVFIPTYSESNYPELNTIIFIIPILVVTLALQTKLGEKITILLERLNDLWEGKSNDKNKNKNKKKSSSLKISQPLSENTNSSSNMLGTTSINSLPMGTTAIQNSSYQTGGGGAYSSPETFFQEDNNQPQIMAANEAIGGSFGSGF
jgi:hypothetical protein